MIADMLSHKKRNLIVKELFLRDIIIKLNISLVFTTHFFFFFAEPKVIRINSTHYFIMEIPYKRELQQIAITNLSDIYLRDVMNLYKK